jgi:hypothetical protein
VFYFLFHAVPDGIDQSNAVHGGAYACCWIDRPTRLEAEKTARSIIAQEGWLIRELEEAKAVDRSTYIENPEGLEDYEQALIDKEVVVFVVYPVGDDTDEE